MALHKGFSLIETLIAVVIASIATLALMQVVSRSSSVSAGVIDRYDSSLLMGLIAGSVTDSMQDREIRAGELLRTRYRIDHPAILDALDARSYRIHLYPKEHFDPVMSVSIRSFDTGAMLRQIAVQKVVIEAPEGKKRFFRLTPGGQ